MTSNKIACCSTLNDKYLHGFLAFFYSLKKHNPNFDYPYHIFSWGDLCEYNKEWLKRIYPNFVFNDIVNKDYDGIEYSTTWRTWDINCANRFEIFTLTQYDKLVFFDADMIVQHSLDELFEIDMDFGAVVTTPGVEMDHPGRFDQSIKTFDGGLMVIGKKYLNEQTKNDLISIAKQKAWTSDEPILNVFFDNAKTTFIPKQYNLLSQEMNSINFNDAKIVQFVGHKKPWFNGTIIDRYDGYIFQAVNNMGFMVRVDMYYKSILNSALTEYGNIQ
jgi:lipopolysaccharide biosynthesis glycosyltransferase